MADSFANNTLVRTGLSRLEYATSIDSPTPPHDPAPIYQAYTRALDYLIQGLPAVNDQEARQWLQQRIEQAMARAETLQQQSRSSSSSTTTRGTSSATPAAAALAPAQPIEQQLATAIAAAHRAVQADTAGDDYQLAYDEYKAALEILVPLAQPAWRSRTRQYMERAEELAAILNSRSRRRQSHQEAADADTTTTNNSAELASTATGRSEVVQDIQRVTREVSYCRERIQNTRREAGT